MGLRQMLVLQLQAIELKRRATAPLMILDHRAAATGIAADCVDGDRVVGRNDPGIHQRADQANGTGGIATGIGDLARRSNAIGLARQHLGEAIGPVGVDAMGGARVQEFRCRVAQSVRQRGQLARRVVRQAKNDQIDLCHHVAACGRITTMLGRDALQSQVRQRAQAVTDAEARSACFAINEYPGHFARHGPTPFDRALHRVDCAAKQGQIRYWCSAQPAPTMNARLPLRRAHTRSRCQYPSGTRRK